MRALLLTALLISGCQTTWHEGASVTSASGQRLCAKHRVPLITIRAYQAPTTGGQVWFVHDANRWYYNIVGIYYPNHIPEHVSLRPASIAREPTTISYCPLCEREFLDALRVPDEAAAIKYAKAALPNYGGGGVPTKGPYHVSFEKGLWTVRCYLQDGRRALIKISKDDGTVEATEFHK